MAGITPAVLWAGGGELGNVGTHVGYGVTGSLATGYNSGSAGTKRAGQNMIDVLGSFFAGYSDRLVFADYDEPGDPSESWFGDSTPLDLEYGIAPGDSGGGLFIGSTLAGVHSFLAWGDGAGDADYGDLGASVRVSQFQDWITTNASGTTWTPEPSSFLIWSGMTVGLLFARRIRRRRAPCK